MHQHHSHRDLRGRAMAASLFVSFLMLSGKMTAYFITGSAAIFSDAMESVIHLLATGFATFSLCYSIRPADPSQRWVRLPGSVSENAREDGAQSHSEKTPTACTARLLPARAGFITP